MVNLALIRLTGSLPTEPLPIDVVVLNVQLHLGARFLDQTSKRRAGIY